jgi:2-phospho-L-lactate/phosphoenolpyruvate guanylyltransferase
VGVAVEFQLEWENRLKVPAALELSLRPAAPRGCCVLIAVNRRAAGKSRLAASLEELERIELIRSMLINVIEACLGATLVGQLVVVSPERDTVPADIPVLADSGRGLNRALTKAHHALLRFGAAEVLILPADLPTLVAAEVDALIEAGRRAGIALAPDCTGTGTNGMYLASSLDFAFQFGPGSRDRHVSEALRLGLTVETVSKPGLEFDVDCPGDLSQWDRQCRPLPLQA